MVNFASPFSPFFFSFLVCYPNDDSGKYNDCDGSDSFYLEIRRSNECCAGKESNSDRSHNKTFIHQ